MLAFNIFSYLSITVALSTVRATRPVLQSVSCRAHAGDQLGPPADQREGAQTYGNVIMILTSGLHRSHIQIILLKLVGANGLGSGVPNQL